MMRDAFLSQLQSAMIVREDIFCLSADFGAPALDRIRTDFPDRFVNVGIAEQNLVNIAAGLALEGFTVYTYAIAAFYLRAYEQIRINLSLLSQSRRMNVNLIGVGAGCSYVMAGPSHHCFEDISIFRTLPNLEVVSPSDDHAAAASFTLSRQDGIRYYRFDSQNLPALDANSQLVWPASGFRCLTETPDPCCVLVSTGFMTGFVRPLAAELTRLGLPVRHLDLLLLQKPELTALRQALNAKLICTFEEGFVGRGGMDALIRSLLAPEQHCLPFGIPPQYQLSHSDRTATLTGYGLHQDLILSCILAQTGKEHV